MIRVLYIPQVLGLVQNMSSFVCPNCGYQTAIFGEGGVERVAEEMGLEVLGTTHGNHLN